MRHCCSTLLTPVLLLALRLTSAEAAPGESGMSMLKLGLPVRSTAMADASASWIRGASAAWHNPAGLRTDDGGVELMLAHREWIQDARVEFLGASFPVGDESAFGFSLATQTVPEIEIRTRPGAVEGTFTARTLAVGLSYALPVSERFRVGGTAKLLYEKILVDEASGIGLDAGVQWQSPLPELSVGMALTNLGSMSMLRGESTTLPASVRTGAAWQHEVGDLGKALLTADLLYVVPEAATYGAVGGEVLFRQHVALRAGYHLGSETRGLTAGVGVAYGIVRVDYAYAAIAQDLGNAHSIGIALIL